MVTWDDMGDLTWDQMENLTWDEVDHLTKEQIARFTNEVWPVLAALSPLDRAGKSFVGRSPCTSSSKTGQGKRASPFNSSTTKRAQ